MLKSAFADTSPDHQALQDAAQAAQNLLPSSSEKEELDEYLNGAQSLSRQQAVPSWQNTYLSLQLHLCLWPALLPTVSQS